MKKIIFPLLAAAAIIAAPAAFARTMHESGSWNVLLDGNTDTCFAANRGATDGEVKVGGPYATRANANAVLGAAIQCATTEVTN
jgi:hypothetical protein